MESGVGSESCPPHRFFSHLLASLSDLSKLSSSEPAWDLCTCFPLRVLCLALDAFIPFWEQGPTFHLLYQFGVPTERKSEGFLTIDWYLNSVAIREQAFNTWTFWEDISYVTPNNLILHQLLGTHKQGLRSNEAHISWKRRQKGWKSQRGWKRPRKQSPLSNIRKAHVTPQTEAAGTGHAWVSTTSSASILWLSGWCFQCGCLILGVSFGFF